MDITSLILDDHHEQRRIFEILEQIGPANPKALQPIWNRLAAFLEAHAKAEEAHFYPMLLKVGRGAGSKPTPESETEDAIGDHNSIRNAIAEVAKYEVGTQPWFEAIARVNKANSEHMAEEEREGLKDFRRHAGLQMRHDLAVAFAAFEAQHLGGIVARNQDPKAYVEQHRLRRS